MRGNKEIKRNQNIQDWVPKLICRGGGKGEILAQWINNNSFNFGDGNLKNWLNYTRQRIYVTNRTSLIRNIRNHRTVGTWIVRGMNIRKLEIVKKERENVYRDIFGISEIMWMGKGIFV